MSRVNVLPNWWAFSFIGIQLGGLLPLAYKHVINPLGSFQDMMPKGIDPVTDGITSSKRLEMAGGNAAQSFLMIAWLFVGITIFAKYWLKGQPKLQQGLMKLPIYCGLFSDVWLYATLALMIPTEILLTPALWTDSIRGIIYGLPVATLLKLLWLFGIGRSVV